MVRRMLSWGSVLVLWSMWSGVAVGQRYPSRPPGLPSRRPPARRESGAAQGALAARAEVKITVDVRTNSLIVIASEDNLAIVEKLVEALDTDPADKEATMVYPCKNANAIDLANVLNDLFAEENQRSRAPRRGTTTRSTSRSPSSFYSRSRSRSSSRR